MWATELFYRKNKLKGLRVDCMWPIPLKLLFFPDDETQFVFQHNTLVSFLLHVTFGLPDVVLHFHQGRWVCQIHFVVDGSAKYILCGQNTYKKQYFD